MPASVCAALAVPGEQRFAVRHGASISYFAWGEPGRPLVVLVHGRGASARWWAHVAPLLADGVRVVALDLSGHGDSGWRPAYDFQVWAEDILAVAAAEDSATPVLIGHSMGSTACLTAATQRPGIRGLVLIDSPIGIPHGARGGAAHKARTYATREEAVGRFRLLPPDPVTCPAVEEHIAEHSVRPVGNGWAFASDPVALEPVLLPVEEVPAVPARSPSSAASGGSPPRRPRRPWPLGSGRTSSRPWCPTSATTWPSGNPWRSSQSCASC